MKTHHVGEGAPKAARRDAAPDAPSAPASAPGAKADIGSARKAALEQ